MAIEEEVADFVHLGGKVIEALRAQEVACSSLAAMGSETLRHPK
jgi:hypothetical protein